MWDEYAKEACQGGHIVVAPRLAQALVAVHFHSLFKGDGHVCSAEEDRGQAGKEDEVRFWTKTSGEEQHLGTSWSAYTLLQYDFSGGTQLWRREREYGLKQDDKDETRGWQPFETKPCVHVKERH